MYSFFSESTSLYFFSTIIQANAAIISLAGVFIVFKIQGLQSSINVIRSSLYSESYYTTPDVVAEFDNKSLEKKKEKLSKQPFNTPRFHLWCNYLSEIDRIKSAIKLPAIISIISIVVFIVLLIFAYTIHNYGTACELIILVTSTLFEFMVLGIVIRSFYDLLFKIELP